MRRLFSGFVVMGVLTVSVALAAPAGAAAPTSVPGPCATYPVGICQAEIQSSTTTPIQGQTIEVSGLKYQPNEDVALTIGGISVGTAHTNSNGSFDPPAVVPATLLGDQPLTGTGASGKPYDVDSLVLNIRAPGAASSGSSGGLASTGVQVAAISAVGAALIIAGLVFAMVGRRRRSAHGS